MKVESRKPYDLEKRTFQFAKKVALLCQNLKKTTTNYEYARQLIRSSGSVGANYIEANEALGKRDFVMKIKTCRKESKESAYWIRLILETNGEEPKQEASALMNEAVELKKIFSAIVEKTM
ncbi:MAG: four helix bundle protein [Bacteroidota bacterium]